MANTPEMINGLINEFNDEIYLQIQEKLSKTRPYVNVVTISKEEQELNDMGGVKFKKSNSAFVNVNDVMTDPKYGVRKLKTDSYYTAIKMNNLIADMTAPGSSKIKDKIIEQIVNEYQFTIDKIIYEAMDADAIAKDGTHITFASERAGTIDLKAIADFTTDNIIKGKTFLTSKGFGIAENSRIAWMGTDIERNLLEILTANADYKEGLGVVRDNDSNLVKFKGLDLITFASVGSEAQPSFFYKSGTTLGTNYRKTFMFNTTPSNANLQSAITLGIRKDLIQDIYEPKDYFNTTVIKGDFHMGATRNANSGIVEVKTPVSIN